MPCDLRRWEEFCHRVDASDLRLVLSRGEGPQGSTGFLLNFRLFGQASSPARMAESRIPSKVPAPPMEAIATPRGLRVSAPM